MGGPGSGNGGVPAVHGAWQALAAVQRLPPAVLATVQEVGELWHEQGPAGILAVEAGRGAVLARQYGDELQRAGPVARAAGLSQQYHRFVRQVERYAKWQSEEEARRVADASSSWLVYADDPARPAGGADAGGTLAADVAQLRQQVAAMAARLAVLEAR